ncbi:MAG: SDR family oxidoreductase [Burkholderiales bacterium]|nr:SDR family oxidoreductase [Burkholderiales bacterium]
MSLFARYPSLQNRTVLITGGATGIGASLVEAFADQGARVGFVDLAVAEGRSLAARLSKSATPPLFIAADLTDTAALVAATRQVHAAFGPITVLLNNAANDRRHALDTVTPESWDAGIGVNLKHQFFAAQAVAPDMKGAGGGSIVNFGSISWMLKQGGMPVYTTSKAAVQGLTRSLARDLGPFGIRVNTLVPGWVMTEKQLRLWVTDESRAEIARGQCLAAALEPAHIARMALFLAADDSAMCTAQDFVVDGGWV